MESRHLNLNLLLVLEAVYKERNVSRAANRLGISQPSVSNSLRVLRKHLDDPLFVRTPDGMVPTSYMESIINRISESLLNIDSCLVPKSVFNEEGEHRFTLMIENSISSVLLPRLLNLIVSSSPMVSINTTSLKTKELYKNLNEKLVDVVIASNLNDDRLFDEIIIEDNCMILSSRRSGGAEKNLSIDEFCDSSHILYKPNGESICGVDVALEKMSRNRRIALSTNHISDIPQLLEGGDYLVALPSAIALIFQEIYGLKVHYPPLDVEPYRFSMYWHPSANADPASMWIRDKIRDAVRK